MQQGATARKVPRAARFVDLSDYARPLAVWIAGRLRDTSVTAPAVTVVWAIIGVAGAFCYGYGGYHLALWGAAALQAKNILDAVDGSLARLQSRPSRVGRFLDSISDAAVAVALYGALAIAVGRERPIVYSVALALAALILGLLQGSIFNYYYVRYRRRQGGDRTSLIEEKLTQHDEIHYEDRPMALDLLRTLIKMYKFIYRWQDKLVWHIDAWAAAPLTRAGRAEEVDRLRDDRRLLTAISALGPGIQILVLNIYTVAGYWKLNLMLELFMWTVALAGSLFSAAIIVYLRLAASRAASTTVTSDQ